MKTARELIQEQLDKSHAEYAKAVDEQRWHMVDIWGARSGALKFALQVMDLEDACK